MITDFEDATGAGSVLIESLVTVLFGFILFCSIRYSTIAKGRGIK